MNYADFGVSGPDELEQDEWSLTRPTFETPRGGVLTVLGWKGRSYSNKLYIARCSLCSQDEELFGQGLFSSPKNSLLARGLKPCGCAARPVWSEDQYRIRVQREAEKQGCTFNGWVKEFKGSRTKCRLSCPKHGEWEGAGINDFLRGHGCMSCGRESTTNSHLGEDSSHIEEFMSTGAFLPGTRFWRSERRTNEGRGLYWNYTCPKCSHDEYVEVGLCDGLFENYLGRLKKGQLSCRCTSKFRWTKEQREYQIKKETFRRRSDGGSHLQFVRWRSKKGYTNNMSKFISLCPKHGEWEISVASFLYGRCGCPRCAGQNQKQAYINTVEDGEVPVALKLGIANDSSERVSEQNRRNLFQSTTLGVWVFHTVESCKTAERECKRDLVCGVLSEREMKDGWTETVSVLDLEKVIAIYEKHGGVRIK